MLAFITRVHFMTAAMVADHITVVVTAAVIMTIMNTTIVAVAVAVGIIDMAAAIITVKDKGTPKESRLK